jgi:hypothetical protein
MPSCQKKKIKARVVPAQEPEAKPKELKSALLRTKSRKSFSFVLCFVFFLVYAYVLDLLEVVRLRHRAVNLERLSF